MERLMIAATNNGSRHSKGHTIRHPSYPDMGVRALHRIGLGDEILKLSSVGNPVWFLGKKPAEDMREFLSSPRVIIHELRAHGQDATFFVNGGQNGVHRSLHGSPITRTRKGLELFGFLRHHHRHESFDLFTLKWFKELWRRV